MRSKSVHCLSGCLSGCLSVLAAAALLAGPVWSVPPAHAGPSLSSQLHQLADNVKVDAVQVANDARRYALSTKKKAKRAASTAKNIYRGLTSEPPTITTAPGAVAPPPAPSLAGIGTYQVEEQSYAFVDPSRPTESTKQFPSVPQRSLPTLVWLPKDAPAGLAFPLVVFAHGLGANAGRYRDLLKGLAGAGYVVAAPTFPVSSKLSTDSLSISDVVGVGSDVFVSETGQPRDLSFVIDQMLALNAPGGALAGRIDPTRLAAVGHSLGAVSVIDQGYNECCIDRRLRAVAAISGFQNITRSTSFFTKAPIPLLLIHGDQDSTVPYLGSLLAFEGAGSPKSFLTIRGGEHSFVLKGKPDSQLLIGGIAVQAVVDWFDRYVKDAPDGLKRLQTLADSQPALLQLTTG